MRPVVIFVTILCFVCVNGISLDKKNEKDQENFDDKQKFNASMETSQGSSRKSLKSLLETWRLDFQYFLNQIQAISFQKSSHRQFCSEFCADFYTWCRDLCAKITKDEELGIKNYLQYYPCSGSCVIHSVSCCVSP